MKSFKTFCKDANLKEAWWSPFSYTPNIPNPPRPPLDDKSYKKYQSERLNKKISKSKSLEK